MSPGLAAVIGIVVLLVIGVFVLKITGENKAKKNYKPPVPSEKTVLPDVAEEKLPARSRDDLKFCPNCGAANAGQSAACSECGFEFSAK